MKQRVGFIGVGTMGKPMATNLLKNGYPVIVYDINPKPVEELTGKGAETARSSKEIAQSSEVVITMLPKSEHVEAVILGPDGVLEGTHRGALVIDMSTIGPASTRKIAQALAEKGVEMLDAPVTGGDTGAQAATLTIMVGGKEDVYRESLDILKTMGKNIFYCGHSGNGEIVKLVNNFFGGVHAISTAEALSLGVKAGVDFKVLCDVIGEGTGATGFMKYHCPNKAFKGDYEPGFMTELMQKDLGLVVNLGQETGVPLLMGGLAFQMFTLATASGLGKRDFSVVVKMFEDMLKVKLKLQ